MAHQKLAIIDRGGMDDGVENGIDSPSIGVIMDTTVSLLANRLDALSDPTLVVRIVFILAAGSRDGSAGIVDGLDGSGSRVRGCILRGWSNMTSRSARRRNERMQNE